MDKNIKIIRDNSGREVVLIDEIIFHGRRNIDWKAVEIYLKKYVGELVELSDTKEMIQIRKDFPDEYTSSVYTNKLKGSYAKAKANLSQGILQVMKIAKKVSTQENKKRKHIKSAFYGWNYYETRFALPIYHDNTEKINYNFYSALLVVQYSRDGKLYLYDIQNIKKETSNPS